MYLMIQVIVKTKNRMGNPIRVQTKYVRIRRYACSFWFQSERSQLAYLL